MTKNEFMQEAALRILSRDSESSMISIADCAAELTEEVWNRLEGNDEQKTPTAVSSEYSIHMLAKEIARLEHEYVLKKNEELLSKGHHCSVQKAGADIRFLNVCNYEGIVTVSDLLSCGRVSFRNKRNIGEQTLQFVDKSLESLYNIKAW